MVGVCGWSWRAIRCTSPNRNPSPSPCPPHPSTPKLTAWWTGRRRRPTACHRTAPPSRRTGRPQPPSRRLFVGVVVVVVVLWLGQRWRLGRKAVLFRRSAAAVQRLIGAHSAERSGDKRKTRTGLRAHRRRRHRGWGDGHPQTFYISVAEGFYNISWRQWRLRGLSQLA